MQSLGRIFSSGLVRRTVPLTLATPSIRGHLTPTPDSSAVACAESSSQSHRAPRYPIVLCHGLFGFDRKGPASFPSLQVYYWRDISFQLRALGCQVHEARVPAAGSVADRAAALRTYLDSLGHNAVNLVAHSMGGLDSRYMISKLSPTTKVLSLTTISTPHRGSSFMDWCAKVFKVGRTNAPSGNLRSNLSSSFSDLPLSPSSFPSSSSTTTAKSTAENLERFRDTLGRLVDLPAYANLTTSYCKAVFNNEIQNSPDTLYFSYGAHKHIPLWAPLGVPHEIIKAQEGDNDGLVSVASAKWGTYLGTLPSDHWGLNNRWSSLNKKSTRFDAVSFYKSAVTRLSNEGC